MSAAAHAAAAGYHRARGGEEHGGSWGARTWSGERGDNEEEDEVEWSASEQACLRKSVKENGLDDWTLGDWSEVRNRRRHVVVPVIFHQYENYPGSVLVAFVGMIRSGTRYLVNSWYVRVHICSFLSCEYE